MCCLLESNTFSLTKSPFSIGFGFLGSQQPLLLQINFLRWSHGLNSQLLKNLMVEQFHLFCFSFQLILDFSDGKQYYFQYIHKKATIMRSFLFFFLRQGYQWINFCVSIEIKSQFPHTILNRHSHIQQKSKFQNLNLSIKIKSIHP